MQSKQNRTDPKFFGSFKVIFVTCLAWLGLAGLSDNFVEWQNWFDAGVMQHWRSVKVWVNYSIFNWLGIEIPSFVFDWVLLGLISFRASLLAVGRHVSPSTMIALLIPQMALGPLVLVFVLVTGIFGATAERFGHSTAMFISIVDDPKDDRADETFINFKEWAKFSALCTIGFLPILFVVSDVLYSIG